MKTRFGMYEANIVSETLTDGSQVYNVELENGAGDVVVIDCRSEQEALKLCEKLIHAIESAIP